MIQKSILLMIVSLFSVYTIAECSLPSAPKLPDGAISTLEEMLSGQKTMKAFQAEVVEYRACLVGVGIEEEVGDDLSAAQAAIDEKLDEMRQQVLEADDDEKAAHEALLSRYNAAVDSEAAIADEFNIEIREYKAANQ